MVRYEVVKEPVQLDGEHTFEVLEEIDEGNYIGVLKKSENTSYFTFPVCSSDSRSIRLFDDAYGVASKGLERFNMDANVFWKKLNREVNRIKQQILLEDLVPEPTIEHLFREELFGNILSLN